MVLTKGLMQVAHLDEKSVGTAVAMKGKQRAAR